MSQPQPKHVRSRRGAVKSKSRVPAFLLVPVVVVAIGIGGVAASSGASAHTPTVSATCSTLDTNLVHYQVKPGSPEIPGALITAEIAAWDEPGDPGQPYVAPMPDVPATYGPTEYLWQSWNWDTLVLFDQKWSASSPGFWWGKVHPVQSRQGPELTPFIAGDPGQPYIAPTVVHHDAIPAVYGPVTPAVPADSTPNNVVVTIDGVVQDNVNFGSSFTKSYPFSNSSVAHTWSVIVVAWDDPSGSNGWTKTYNGTTTPCYDNSLRPSLSASSQCGSWTGTFNNPTKYGWVPDYRVDGEAASGPGWGTGEVYRTVYIPAFGGTQTRTVSFPEDSGMHTVMYRLNVGPEQDWYIPAVTVNIETDCESNEVTPAVPGFTPSTCTAEGSVVAEATEDYFYETTNEAGSPIWTYTAIPNEGVTLIGQTVWTFNIAQRTGGECTPLVTPVAPTPTPPTCFASGTLVGTDTPVYIWIRTGSDSEAVLTAVAITAGTNLTGQTSFGPYDLTQLTGDACSPPPTSVIPVLPGTEPQKCMATDNGQSFTGGSVTFADTPDIAYSIEGGETTGLAPDDYVVTATVDAEADFTVLGEAEGWTLHENGTATATVTIDEAEGCAVQPPDKKIEMPWTDDGTWKCNDTTVMQTRKVWTIPYILVDNTWVLDEEHATVPVTETRPRDLLPTERTTCTVPTTPPVVPPTVNPNRPVPAKVQTDGAQLNPMSDNNEALIGLGLLLAAGGAAWLLKSRRREAQD